MSACMKGETTKSQVNLRSGPSASASSITRLPLGAEIEVDYDTPYVTNAEEWYCVAYNNKYLGYMRFDMFKITDRTRKYYMISMLDRYGTSTWVRGHKDADELHIYYQRRASHMNMKRKISCFLSMLLLLNALFGTIAVAETRESVAFKLTSIALTIGR